MTYTSPYTLTDHLVKSKKMKSITKATILTLEKGGRSIEIEEESVEICVDPNCTCVGSWGHSSNEKKVKEALKEGFKIVVKREESY